LICGDDRHNWEFAAAKEKVISESGTKNLRVIARPGLLNEGKVIASRQSLRQVIAVTDFP
jgi:hypothetical protein